MAVSCGHLVTADTAVLVIHRPEPPGSTRDVDRRILGDMLLDAVDLMSRQSGVIARFQARDLGVSEGDLRRLLRRREWAVVHPGVYVDHTGPLTWLQRSWSGVLVAWPAALTHDSALRAVDGPGRRGRRDDDPIQVAVDRDRTIRVPDGIILHRLADFDAKVVASASPPRIRVEHAALDVAAEARDDAGAAAVLADLVQSRRTTARRLLTALAGRSRIARRGVLAAVLSDIAEGTCSVLEHDFLTLVERAHGLPRADRQVLDSRRGPLYRDVVYLAFGVMVELEGRLFHDSARDRDLDLERDLDAAVDGLLTVRLGWGQAHSRACTTAAKVGAILGARGWKGELLSCSHCGRDGGELPSPGDSRSPLSA